MKYLPKLSFTHFNEIIKNTAFIILIYVFLVSCNLHKPEHRLLFNEEVLEKIHKYCPSTERKIIRLYYLDGNCSFCIAKAYQIDLLAEKKGIATVFVSISDNEKLTEYYFKDKKINGCLISGKDSLLSKSGIYLNDVVDIQLDNSFRKLSDEEILRN